ncbi:MAG: VC_2705 family sodium/solute symporter [Deltaproteobacteria bacterium]|nr:VC_2705 family sodium/solute symporter [Candidatus Anaeroferrophillus wilburensis]MBN2888780.1 VC_2705 family sodium/solute symporter [Deltaproteobacteria bacterium]
MGVETGFKLGPAIILAIVLACFVGIGVGHKAKDQDDYWAAGRGIGRIGAGAAIASNWMSAASFLGMAGLLYLKGYFALAYILGWTGGYVMLLVLMAGQIRRFGKYTAADFIGDRFESQGARIIAALTAIIISLTYSIAQYKGIALMFSWVFGFNYATSVIVGTAVVLAYIIIAGMLGATKNMQFQYVIIITAFIFPLVFIARKLGYFFLIPEIGYGAAVYDIGNLYANAANIGKGAATAIAPELAEQIAAANVKYVAPWGVSGTYKWIALCFTMMVGTAGLPHVLSRFYVVPNTRDARWSVVWGLFFIGLLYWSSPAYAAFARVMAAKAGMVPKKELADAIVVLAAERAGLPQWFCGYLAAGAISAAFSTVSGLLLAAGSAASHDIYYRVINPNASENARMMVSKVAVFALGLIVIAFALKPFALIAQIVAMAFAIAGNTIFPTFLLGVWWSRSNKYGCIAGMLVGLFLTAFFFFWGKGAGKGTWLSELIPFTSSSLILMPVAFFTNIIVSMATEPPSVEIRKYLCEKVHGVKYE